MLSAVKAATLACLVALAIAPRDARADGTLLTDDTWNVTSCGCWTIDGGLVVGFPAALRPGSRGVSVRA